MVNQAQTINRRSEEMTDGELLRAYAAAYQNGNERAARIFEAEIEHRDCWR